MTPLRLSIITPSQTGPAIILCPNAVFGDTVLQVLDTTSGVDVTNSFDAVIPYSGVICQITNNPVPADTFLVVLEPPGSPAPTARLAILNSLGPTASAATVVAAGVHQGDIVLKAYYGLTDFTGDASIDCTMSFAPTAPSPGGLLTQLVGIPIGGSVLVLLQRAGTAPTNLMIAMEFGMVGQGQMAITSDPNAIPSVLSGTEILNAIDMTFELDRTAEFSQFASRPGNLDQISTTVSQSMMVFLLENP